MHKVLQERARASEGKSGNVNSRGRGAPPFWGPIMSAQHPQTIPSG